MSSKNNIGTNIKIKIHCENVSKTLDLIDDDSCQKDSDKPVINKNIGYLTTQQYKSSDLSPEKTSLEINF